MTEAAMVFHHPLPLVDSQGKSGSQVRPAQMARAFEDIGYRVELIAGYGQERKLAARQVINRLKSDKDAYAFVYSESSTQPTLLTERHHWPVHPMLDFGFLNSVRKFGVPVGLFYRDLHWRTEHYQKNLTVFKRAITVPLYHYDFTQYTRVVDHLFLPDMAMHSLLPKPWNASHISALPPGGIIQRLDASTWPSLSRGIRLLYVGGIVPPLYDLSAILNAVAGLENIHLTICCRAPEWQSQKERYSPLPANVTIVHAAGEELDLLYAKCHIAIVNSIHWYQKITIPVKFFEGVGYGKPTILVGRSALAELVADEGIAWNLESADEIPGLLSTLLADTRCYEEKVDAVMQKRERHSWASRARQVESVMEGYMRKQ